MACCCESNVVCFERVAFVSVLGKSLAALLFAIIIRGYKFRDPWERLSARWYFNTEIDEEVAVGDDLFIAAYRYRGDAVIRYGTKDMVRHETAFAKSP